MCSCSQACFRDSSCAALELWDGMIPIDAVKAFPLTETTRCSICQGSRLPIELLSGECFVLINSTKSKFEVRIWYLGISNMVRAREVPITTDNVWPLNLQHLQEYQRRIIFPFHSTLDLEYPNLLTQSRGLATIPN
jgi:hypothetical protein